MTAARSAVARKRGQARARRLRAAVLVLIGFAVLGTAGLVRVDLHWYQPLRVLALSKGDVAIVLLPEIAFGRYLSLWAHLKCDLLGYWQPRACLPEQRWSRVHLWFLDPGGVEYHAVRPFAVSGSAYVFRGELRWQSGTTTWAWRGGRFERLSDLEAREPYTRHRLTSEVLAAEGWSEHGFPVSGKSYRLGGVSLRYEFPIPGGNGFHELTMEAGSEKRRLFRRDEQLVRRNFFRRVEPPPV